jgi:acyl-coenzyme A synthetase/AMP-(fatty) acid ligase
MPKVIFCNERSFGVILKAIKKTNYDPTMVIFGNHPEAIPFANILNSYSNTEVANFRYVELDDIKKTACILHSSGTTGMPKSVELSNFALIMIGIDKALNIVTTVTLWFSSLYWVSGLLMNTKSITQGAKVIIYPEFDEEMTCKLIDKYKVRIVSWKWKQSSKKSNFFFIYGNFIFIEVINNKFLFS